MTYNAKLRARVLTVQVAESYEGDMPFAKQKWVHYPDFVDVEQALVESEDTRARICELAKALIRKLRKQEEYAMEQEQLGDAVGIEVDPDA